MAQIIVRKAKELSPPVREWMSNLLGRELSDDEQVTVAVPGSDAKQENRERASARRDLLEAMDRLSSKFQDVPENELEAAVEEALRVVRPGT